MNNKIICYFYDLVDTNMILDVLKIFHYYGKIILYDVFLTVDYYSDCEEFYVLHSIVRRKYALPNSKSIKKREILSVEESNPSKAIEEWINFELF